MYQGFWVVMSHQLVSSCGRFEGELCLCHQGQEISAIMNKPFWLLHIIRTLPAARWSELHKAYPFRRSDFEFRKLVNLRLLDSECVSSVLPRNVDNYLQWILRDILHDSKLHQQLCECLRTRSVHIVSRFLKLRFGLALLLDVSDLYVSLKY